MPRPSMPLGTRHLIGPMVTSSRVGAEGNVGGVDQELPREDINVVIDSGSPVAVVSLSFWDLAVLRNW